MNYKIKIIILLCLLLPKYSLSAENGIYEHDLTRSFPSLIDYQEETVEKKARLNFPMYKDYRQRIIESDSYYFSFLNVDGSGYEPYAFSKNNKSLIKLTDTSVGDFQTGEEPNGLINRKIFYVGNNQVVFSFINVHQNEPAWYITDGTVKGTHKISLVYESKSDLSDYIQYRNDWADMQPLGKDGFLLADGFRAYKYSFETKEVDLINEIDRRVDKHSFKANGAHFVNFWESVGNKERTAFYYNASSGETKVFKGFEYVRSFKHHKKNNFTRNNKQRNVYFKYDYEGGYKFSRLTGLGIEELADSRNLTNDALDNTDVVEVGDKLFLLRRDNSKVIFSEFNFDEKTVSELYRKGGRVEHFGVTDTHALVLINNPRDKNIVIADLKTKEERLLLPERNREITYHFENDLAFFFSINDIGCSNYDIDVEKILTSCDESGTYRLDKDTFELIKLSELQLQYTSTPLMVDDGDLYVFDSFPTPGIYAFKNGSSAVELIHPLSFYMGTSHNVSSGLDGMASTYRISSSVSTSTPLGNLVGEFSKDEKFFLGYNGQLDELHADFSSIAAQYQNKVYFFKNKLFSELDLNTHETKVLSEDEDYGTFLGVIQDYIFFKGRRGDSERKLIKVDLTKKISVEYEIYLSQFTRNHVFECKNKLFLTTNSSIYLLEDEPKKVYQSALPFRPYIETAAGGSFIISRRSESDLEQFEDIFNCEDLSVITLPKTEGLWLEYSDNRSFEDLKYSYFKNEHSLYFHHFKIDLNTREVTKFSGDYEHLVKNWHLTKTIYSKYDVLLKTSDNSKGFNRRIVYTLFGGEGLIFESETDDGISSEIQFFDNHTYSRFLFGSYKKFNKQYGKGTLKKTYSYTGVEPFIYDSLHKKFHYLDVLKGPASGFSSLIKTEDKEILRFFGYNKNSSGTIYTLDPLCIIDNICNYIPENRLPLVSDGEALFFEKSQNIYLPFRAIDEDGDTLSYRLSNAPNWLSINEHGVINGVVPHDASRAYKDIHVEVITEHGTVMTDKGFDFYIYNGEGSQTDSDEKSDSQTDSSESSDSPSTPRQEPQSKEGASGGVVSIYLLLFLSLILLLKRGSFAYRP